MNVSGLAAEIRRRLDSLNSYQWQQEDVEKMIRECLGVAEGTQQNTKLTTFQCDCGRKLLVEGNVVGKEFVGGQREGR